MEVSHLGSGNRICTVLFVDLVRYSAEPVSEQVEMKARFSALLAAALEHTPAADRLVLDTGDGAALCFLGDPEDALFAANSLRSGVREAPESHGLQLRLGINLGPVRVVKDINGHSNVIGDGINVAQRVMGFAEPNQILVSRSYFEVVSRLSPEYGRLFHYAGVHRDKHVREHEVYEVHLTTAPVEQEKPAGIQAAESADSPDVKTEPGPRFPPALLARLTSALAREIGPVAKLLVRRAADRAADARALMEALAANVPESSRAAFAAGLADLGLVTETGPPEPGQPGTSPRHETADLGPALLARAEQILTRQIGPVARILVRQAAKGAASPRELFERLAAHIDDDEVRRAFMAEADRPV